MRLSVKLTAMILLAVIIGPLSLWGADRGVIYFSAGSKGVFNVWSIRPDGNKLTRITTGAGVMRFPAVSADGNKLVCINEERMPVMIDIASAKVTPIPVPRGIYSQPAWLPSGDALLYVRYRVLPADRSEIWSMRKNKKGWDMPVRITSFPPMFLFPAPCPKGHLMACTQFYRDKNRRAVEEIFLMKMDGSGRRALTKFSADSYGPAWSPEGKKILFTSNFGGDYNIWLYDLKDSKTRMLTSYSGFDGEPAWSPDGRAFVFVSTRSGVRQLWLKNMDMGPAIRLAHIKGNVMNPVWSR